MSASSARGKTAWKSCSEAVLILLGLSLLLGACQPGMTPSAVPSPQVIDLQLTSSLLPLRPLLKTCTTALDNHALVIQERPASALDSTAGGPALRWGIAAPPTGYAAVLGQEELVVVVHPRSLLDQVSLADLQAMYAGARKQWPESGPGAAVQPWSYPAGEDIQAIFVSALLNGAQPARGAAFLAPDPQAMLEAVSTNPGAIGFVPRRWLSAQVKPITVAGVDRAALRQPILALTQSEPEGSLKQWLLCLRDDLVE